MSGRDAGVLAGIRVLDFGKHVAGPWCGALLADLGADVPVGLSATPGRIRGPAPSLGADTDTVLRELGYEDTQIDAWQAQGIV